MVSKFVKKLLLKFQSNFNLPHNKTFIIPTVFGIAYGVTCIFILAMGFMQSNSVVYLVAFLAISLGVNSLRVTNKIISSVTVHFPDVIFGPAMKESKYYLQISCPNEIQKINFEISCMEKYHLLQDGTTMIESPNIDEGWNKKWILKISTTAPFGLSRSWKLIPMNCKIIGFPLPQGQSLVDSFNPQSKDHFEGEIEPLKNGEAFQKIIWRIFAKNGKKVRWSESVESSKNYLIFDYDLIDGKSHLDKLRQLSRWIQDADKLKIPFILKYPGSTRRSSEQKSSAEKNLLALSEWGFNHEI